MEGLGGGRCRGCWAGTNLVYMKWHRTGRSAQRLAESDMKTWMLQATVQPIATTQVQTPPTLGHVDAPFGVKETSLDTGDSVMVHNTRATETTLTACSTACIEEHFAGKETAQDIPTIAPSLPPN